MLTHDGGGGWVVVVYWEWLQMSVENEIESAFYTCNLGVETDKGYLRVFVNSEPLE